MGLSPSIRNDAGAPRETPTGQALDGVYRETYWLYKFAFPSDTQVEACIATALKLLTPKRRFLSHVTASGGRCELFIGVFLNKNSGMELDGSLLRKVAHTGLELSMSFYLPDS
jgi:hypothetical protein